MKHLLILPLLALIAVGCTPTRHATDMDRLILPSQSVGEPTTLQGPATLGVANVQRNHQQQTPWMVTPFQETVAFERVVSMGHYTANDNSFDRTLSNLYIRAERSGCDLLLLYTVAGYHRDTNALAPLSIATLGLLPTNRIEAESRIDWALIDPLTGYIYVQDSVNARAGRAANAWTSERARDGAYERAEEHAIADLEQAVTDALPLTGLRKPR